MVRWGVLYSYTTEVYPTPVRTIGFGVASAFGRVGGAIAPITAGLLIEKNVSIALYVSSGIVASVALCVVLLPIETRGKRIV